MFRASSALLVALVGVVPALRAQDIIPVQGVYYAGHYDMATHTLDTTATDPDQNPIDTGTSTVLYDNAVIAASYYGSTTQTTQYAMDWGVANFGGQGATITDFRMAYGVSQVGGTVGFRIRLHQGATGFGVNGTEALNIDITGLPASPGGAVLQVVDVTLATPIQLADGPIGWSYFSLQPLTGPAIAGQPNGPGVVDAFDRYMEAGGAYIGSYFFGGNPLASFVMRLTGRANGGGGPTAWENYGIKKKVTLTGSGSGLPGSVDGVITIKNNPGGKLVVLVAGLIQSDIFSPNLELQLYAFPWIIQLAPIMTPIIDGTVALPAPLDISLTPGTQIFLQAFGQNLSNEFKNYSEGLQLTIQ